MQSQNRTSPKMHSWEHSPEKYSCLNYKSQEVNVSYKLSLLTNLKTLVINMRNLKAIPSWFMELRNLESLTLITPNLEDLDSINQLKNLKHLHIRGCKKESLQKLEIHQLTSLSLINLGLESVPSFISKINGLETLYLNNNLITNLDQLQSCLSLKRLYLSHNKIESIPDFLFEQSLSIISFDSNPLLKNLKDI